jgi:cytochrome P450
MAELVVHPEVMQRAQKEIDAIVGLDRLVQESDIPKLSLLQAIVKETYRLHPTLPLGFPRESTAPVEALGYKIAAGTRIIYNQYSIHRDPSVYENPDEFNPDRFLHQHLQVNPLSAFDSFELIPFGVGRRICPGNNLGNTVVHFMLANLIHSYDWSLPNGASIDVTDTILSRLGTLYLRSPLTLVPKLRDGVPAF